MTKDEALRLALDALEYRGGSTWLKHGIAVEAIKAALAQPVPDLTEQQREAYQKGHNDGVAHHKQAVKAAQPERKPLTESQIIKIINTHTHDDNGHDDIWTDSVAVARAVEAAHDITGKNK